MLVDECGPQPNEVVTSLPGVTVANVLDRTILLETRQKLDDQAASVQSGIDVAIAKQRELREIQLQIIGAVDIVNYLLSVIGPEEQS
jgi:hypothetical protein